MLIADFCVHTIYHSLATIVWPLNDDALWLQATKSLKLCCQAAWYCILHFCKTFASSIDVSSGDLTEDSIAAFVTDACAKSDFLLDILYQRGSEKITRILTDFLESWVVAHSKLDKIPSPEALIKQWVKVSDKTMPFDIFTRGGKMESCVGWIQVKTGWVRSGILLAQKFISTL